MSMLFSAEKFFEKNERQAIFSRLFRRIFLDDWLMKLVALVITLALWLGVSGFREPITTRLGGVTLQPRVSNDFELTNSIAGEVALVVTGDRRKIDQIRAENLIVSIDLTSLQAGEQILQLTPETVNVELPVGVKLDEIQPNKVAVKLERVLEREIPVSVETEGGLAKDFELYGTTVSPARVRARGPESYIRTLDSIATEKINIEERQESFTAQQISLNIVNPKVTALDSVVNVTFHIGEKRIERLFLVPVQTDEGVKKVKVVLYGGRSLLNDVSPESLQVEIGKTETGGLSLRTLLPPALEGKVEIREAKIYP